MKSSFLRTLGFAALAATGVSADSFPTIEVVGNHFFYSNNGSQFYIKGVAYQKNTANSTTDVTFVDPLADEDTCKRDIPYLVDLHTNVIRVYALDENANHDACMELLQDAGIYVIADLSSPNNSIITTDPEWDIALYDRYTQVVDIMQGYDNVLGFFAGNEVITNSTNSNTAPFVKAAVRDIKSYISEKGYRDIPVGYSANDDADTRVFSADYFACGDNDVKADFYGINMYEWCGSSSFSTSGYKDRTEEFSNLTVPVFFSEYGCNAVQPRKFTEVGTLYSDDMTDVWSGGIVYMYFQEENDYGLVSVDGDTVSTLSDFNYLKSELATVSPSIGSAASASSAAHELDCPPENVFWKAATVLPPTPNSDVCDCIANSVQCTVSDDVDEEDYGDFFSVVCNYVDCSDISVDGEEGTYGGVSYCSAKEKLAYVLNKYYISRSSASTACDFSGSATIVKSTGAASTCSSLIKNALASGNASSGATTGKTSTGSSTNTSSGKSSSATVSSISSTTSKSSGSSLTGVRGSGISGFYTTTLIAAIVTAAISMVVM